MAVRINGRDIYVDTGSKSQTVKICDCQNIRGQYESYFRINGQPQRTTHEMEAELLRRAAQAGSLGDIEDWLRDELGAVDEIVNPPSSRDGSEGDAPPPNVAPIEPGLPGDWFDRASHATEVAINHLIEEFLHRPFLHRVEHCLHTRLCSLLLNHESLSFRRQIGTTGQWTKLVHKEWPEPQLRQGRLRRGSLDLAVLSPHQIENCPDIVYFLEGRLAAPIAIEIGLDYGESHLSADIENLLEVQAAHGRMGYVVHFVRGRAFDDAEMELLQQQNEFLRIACAYVSDDGDWVMRLGEDGIQPA